jgi:predicted Zn-dependent protease
MNKFLLLALLLSFTACREATITGRKQLAMMPESMVVQMSHSAYHRFLLENKQHILSSGPEVELVQAVGKKLADAVEQYVADNNLKEKIAGFDWEIRVLKNDINANAWCLPGGKMMVSTAMIPLTKSALGLAVVMSHEIAHAVSNHGNVRMSQQMISQTGFIAIDMALTDRPVETRDLFMTTYGLSPDPGDMLAYSRVHEAEADKLGLVFMAMAGYDPRAAVAFWTYAASLPAGKDSPQYFTTHLPGSKRISKLKESLPEALKYYNPLQ